MEINSQPARFDAVAPPKDWLRQHHYALQITAVNGNWPFGIRDGRPLPDVIRRNRPVPRRASCHYYAPDAERDVRNFYFY